jgi:cytochrome c peroxidase
MDYGGPGDHIDQKLLHDFDRFGRVPLGGRPTAVRFAADSRRVFVANYLSNSVQEVDVVKRELIRTIDLGGAKEPSLARKGEAIFYDGTRSMDQWYSCHSCHYDGGGNAVAMDTRNDGSFFTFKTVPSLRNVAKTGPWMWHGWQKELSASIEKSITETMLGPTPQPPDVEAVQAYLESLAEPAVDWEKAAVRTPAELRGREVFLGEKGGCHTCHAGPLWTDGRIHDVGTGKPDDRYQGFNTPSLAGVGRKVLLLHDGRAKDLHALLTGPHRPDQVVGRGELTSEEVADLVAYLKTL